MSSEEEHKHEVWECNNCRHTTYTEEEVICWKCGKGEMVYLGKWWFKPIPFWFVNSVKNFQHWWKSWWEDHRGDPEDPDGFGFNLFHLIFWIGVIGVAMGLAIVFG